MHAVSNQFDNALNRIDHKDYWKVKLIPDYKLTPELTGTPDFTGQYTKNRSVSLFRSEPLADTYFEPNIHRNGDMYLMNFTLGSFGVRSAGRSGLDGALEIPLIVRLYLQTKDRSFYPYYQAGFSTGGKNGDFAVDFDIVYFNIVDTYRTVQVRNYDSPYYEFPEYDDVPLNTDVEIRILRMNHPYARGLISRLYLAGRPMEITNDHIIERPSVFKELESQSEIAGSASANEIAFSIFNDDLQIQPDRLTSSSLLDVSYGVQCGDFIETVPYGKYYVRSVQSGKHVLKITAQDEMADMLQQECKDFHLVLSSRSYGDYINATIGDRPVGGVYERKAVMNPRAASMEDIINEVCIITGSCVYINDHGVILVVPRYKTGTPLAINDDMVISMASSRRFVPDTIRLNKYVLENAGTNIAVFDQHIAYPTYSEIAGGYYAIPVEFQLLAQNPYSGDENDVLYASNGVLNRKCWEDPQTPISQSFTVTASNAYQYSKDPQAFVHKFTFGGKELYLDTYIAVMDTYTQKVEAAQTIYHYFKMTQFEHTIEILPDPRLELGDLIAAKGKKGMIYRIELDGGLMKITFRGDQP